RSLGCSLFMCSPPYRSRGTTRVTRVVRAEPFKTSTTSLKYSMRFATSDRSNAVNSRDPTRYAFACPLARARSHAFQSSRFSLASESVYAVLIAMYGASPFNGPKPLYLDAAGNDALALFALCLGFRYRHFLAFPKQRRFDLVKIPVEKPVRGER